MLTEGRILAVQERRFRVLTVEGQVYLLTLATNAPIDELALCHFRDTRTPVQVSFTGQPNLVGGVAHAVLPVAASHA
ncbi:MAG TPA: hypothetical protein VGE94_04765 [Chloroflexota bacterium]